MKRFGCLPAMLVATAAWPAISFAQQNGDMSRLARDSGCYICHSVEARAPAREVLTEGPPFREIAKRYKGQPAAAERLTRTILQGSVPDSTDRHWEGRISGHAMPSNTVEISAPEARQLAQWILSLSK